MDKKEMYELQGLQDAEQVMKWYGWGSPIGLSIFFISLAIIAAIIKFAFLG